MVVAVMVMMLIVIMMTIMMTLMMLMMVMVLVVMVIIFSPLGLKDLRLTLVQNTFALYSNFHMELPSNYHMPL